MCDRLAQDSLVRGNQTGRDLKPANLFLETGQKRLKILDFGLARSFDESQMLTEPGSTPGTPAYMSPEQVRGEPLDVRSDLFSLGVVLYELCTGHHPFLRSHRDATLHAILTEEPGSARDINPEVPAGLDHLIWTLLSKDRERRPASASNVGATLDCLVNLESEMVHPHIRER